MMKRYVLAAMIAATAVLGTASLTPAFAGEGNGPSFPGLQVPNIGVTTNFNGRSHVTSTEDHTADAYAYQVPQSPFPQYGTPAQNRRTLAMVEAASPNR